MELKEFSLRLSQLRVNKGVSAREMSLDIGQSQSYINNIETGVNFPSMTVFFYICEYLDITPMEFLLELPPITLISLTAFDELNFSFPSNVALIVSLPWSLFATVISAIPLESVVEI